MSEKKQNILPSQIAAAEERLRESLSVSVFDTWLKSLSVGGLKEDGTLTLFLPTKFFCSYIARNFADEIENAWQTVNPDVKRIKIGRAHV